MSHEATNWAFKQRGLKPAAKIVLLALADRHNPDIGCFPSKKTISEDCELSERSVYDQIKLLEDMGLIYIEEEKRMVRGQFASNRYILAFEPDFPAQIVPSANSAVGKNERLPSANSAGHRRQILPSNPVREPCKVTSKNAQSAGGVRSVLCTLLSADVADAFIEHRRSKRAKLTAKAAELIVRKLRDHPNPDAEIERTIMQGWTGVFPESRQSQPAQQKSITQTVFDDFLTKVNSQ